MGTVEPDTVSLLQRRAGDIESNPGPGSCKDCGRIFNHQNKPVECSECQSKFCKTAKKGEKTTCCGLTRWKLEKTLEEGLPILCRLCKGERPRRIHPYNEGITPDRCCLPKCAKKRAFKEGYDDFLVCTRCSKQYHKQKGCSGMFRLEVDKLDRAS